MPIAQDMKNITEDIEVSYGERMSWLADATKDTHQMMTQIHGENKEAAEAVARLLSKFSKEQKELASELARFLSLSEKQRLEDFHLMDDEIKKSVADVLNETKAIMGRVRREINEIEAEVAELLSAFQKDIKEARAHWQNLAKIMAAKRAGKSIPSPRAERGVPAAVKEEAEEAFKEGELKERVLKVVQAHPGGIRLSKIGEALKVAYIQVAKPVKDLLSEVKITKQDSEYLPA